MARKKKPKLPAVGAAFAFSIGDGRFSVCRVLLDTSSEQSKQWSEDTILVACSSWIGDHVPAASEAASDPLSDAPFVGERSQRPLDFRRAATGVDVHWNHRPNTRRASNSMHVVWQLAIPYTSTTRPVEMGQRTERSAG